MTESDTKKIALNIFDETIHSPVTSIEVMGNGFGGFVYKISADTGLFVVKLLTNESYPDYDNEEVNDRVYGGRVTEFDVVYNLLKRHAFPLPAVHATGITGNNNFRYIVMDYVEGKSVHEYLKEDQGIHKELHGVVGDILGKLHSLTREYQGWVSMEKPYKEPWGDAFFKALTNQINEIAEKQLLPEQDIESIQIFIAEHKKTWIEPKKFVLSHLDGFQGIASCKNGTWSMGALIDVEDYQYTDQRFVLAGYKLNLECEGKVLPDIFWNEYVKQTKIDASFGEFEPLFKLYYLSVWLCVFSDDDIGTITDRVSLVHNTQRMIQELIKNSKTR